MSDEARTRSPRPRWPLIIVALLGVQMAGVMLMMRIAGSDPAFGIEPDYYEKAVRWDTTAAARANADRLGWSAAATLGPIISQNNERELRVTLTDLGGAPIQDAIVRAEFFSHVRSMSRRSATLTPLEGGVYVMRVVAPGAGLYETRLDVTCRGVSAQLSRTIEVPVTTAAR